MTDKSKSPISLIRSTKSIPKKDVALVIAAITLFAAVVRSVEKRIDSAQASSFHYTDQKFKTANEKLNVQFNGLEKQVGVERNQRQEDIRGLNGKLDTITNLLLDLSGRRRTRPGG